MPRYNHPNIGDVQDHVFIKGVITAVDSVNDLADVMIEGTTGIVEDVPLFYHCTPDSEIRDNGAIYGAAGVFSGGTEEDLTDGDEVIVMCSGQPGSYIPVRVVGLVDGIKTCTKYIYFEVLHNDIVFVWNFKSNILAVDIPLNSGEMAVFPCNKNDISDWHDAQIEAGQKTDGWEPLFSYTSFSDGIPYPFASTRDWLVLLSTPSTNTSTWSSPGGIYKPGWGISSLETYIKNYASMSYTINRGATITALNDSEEVLTATGTCVATGNDYTTDLAYFCRLLEGGDIVYQTFYDSIESYYRHQHSTWNAPHFAAQSHTFTADIAFTTSDGTSPGSGEKVYTVETWDGDQSRGFGGVVPYGYFNRSKGILFQIFINNFWIPDLEPSPAYIPYATFDIGLTSEEVSGAPSLFSQNTELMAALDTVLEGSWYSNLYMEFY